MCGMNIILKNVKGFTLQKRETSVFKSRAGECENGERSSEVYHRGSVI